MWERRPDRRRVLALGGAAALLGGSALGAEVRVMTGSRIPQADNAPYVPPTTLQAVADIYRRMTVSVTLNDSAPYPFVVDTGANQSVIADDIVQALGLPTLDAQPLNGVAGVKLAPTTRARLAVGTRVHEDVTLSVLPAAALGGAGLLGLDCLDGQRLTLDFGGQEMRIEPPRHRGLVEGEVAMRATRRDGQLTLVDADLAGVKVVAFLDSGAQATIGNMALRQMALTRSPKAIWTRTPILSATGQTIEADIADLPALHIGGMHLPNWPVAFADLHTFAMWDLVRRPALLVGVDVLSRFERVSLDFSRDEVTFILPA